MLLQKTHVLLEHERALGVMHFEDWRDMEIPANEVLITRMLHVPRHQMKVTAEFIAQIPRKQHELGQ